MSKKKIKPLFTDGVIDVHFIDVKNVCDDNMTRYEDYLYEAINYAENNKIIEAYLPGEYIHVSNDEDVADIIGTLKSMVFELENYN